MRGIFYLLLGTAIFVLVFPFTLIEVVANAITTWGHTRIKALEEALQS